MILAKGEKIHIIHRKILEHEPHRHFIGIVDACDHGAARVTGHIYTVDRQRGEWVKRNEVRTRIVSLTAGSLIINVLPSEVNLDKIAYVQENKAIRVTDGSSWHLDISEVTWL